MLYHGHAIDAVHRTVTAPDGRVTRVEPQAFELLLYFTANPNVTLSRDQLIREVWNGRFVTDDAVMVAVYALRQAFGDDPRAPRFIETIRGRGYRWIASAEGATRKSEYRSMKAKIPLSVILSRRDFPRSRKHRGEGPSNVRAIRKWLRGKVLRRHAFRLREVPAAQDDRVENLGRTRALTAAGALLIALGVAAFVWAVVRPPLPMPSIEQTNALVRAHARGLFFSERRTRADLEQARAEFRKAMLVDPRFAEPHAALAEVCVRLVEVGSPEVAALEREARRELALAEKLAPHLALSQAARASVQFVLDRDAASAERSFRHAIELDPSLPGIRRRYSYLLGATGRFAEATAQARIAADLEPASSTALADLAWTHVLAGRPGDAEPLYREAVRLDPANLDAIFSLGYCLDLRGAPGEAMQSYRRALQVAGVPASAIARLDEIFASSGLRGVYAAWLDRFRNSDAGPRFVAAFYAVAAGQRAEAMALLRESSERREAGTLWLAVHPAFAPLRGQREFDALVASSFHAR